MALVKCPDCGKMVSSRAAACPVCGCPAEFFEVPVEEISEESKATEPEAAKTEMPAPEMAVQESEVYEASVPEAEEVKSEEAPEENSAPEKEEEVIDDSDSLPDYLLDEFHILGQEIRYPKSAELYINSLRRHAAFACKYSLEAEKKYWEVKDVDKVIDIVVVGAENTINNVVNDNLKLLYNYGIYVSEEDFKKKYKVDITPSIQRFFDDYDRIINAYNDLQSQRQYERSNRSQWTGGGFGIRGAIKGAAKAAAMNAVTGVGRSIGDSVVNSGDNANLAKAKQELYKKEDNVSQITLGIKSCIALADYGLAETLAQHGLTAKINIDMYTATDRFLTALKYESDLHRMALKCLECVCMFPFLDTFYSPIIKEAGKNFNDADELVRFMKFWRVEGYFPECIEESQKRNLVNGYIEEHQDVLSIDFTDNSPANYVRLKGIRNELNSLLQGHAFPATVPFCVSLQRYFDACLSTPQRLASIEVMDELDKNSSEEFFIQCIHNEKMQLNGLLKGIWIKGDKDNIPEAKIKTKWGLPQEDTIYMYQNTALLGTMLGGKGFVLTNSVICDLATKTVIPWNQVKQINVTPDYIRVTISSEESAITIDLGPEMAATRAFLSVCLQEFKNRYVTEDTKDTSKESINPVQSGQEADTANDNDMISCPSCGKSIKRNSKFCVYCGSNIGDKITEVRAAYTVVCPECGKSLKEGAKFCNYCGAKLQREGEVKPPSNTYNELYFGTVNSGQDTLSDLDQYIIDNFDKANKVKAIKYYREKTGLGLKEAKDKVDSLLID